MSLPVTVIQIEAQPVECHYVQFAHTDEHTGRPVRSALFGSADAALKAWSDRGVTEADLVTTDARIDAIRSVLHELETAFASSGAVGVSYALAARDFKLAQSRLDGAGIDLSLVTSRD